MSRASTSRPTVGLTSPPLGRSARCASSRARTRAEAFAVCGSAFRCDPPGGVLLLRPLRHSPGALLLGEVFDAGHDGPADPEGVADAGETVAGHERHQRFADGRAGSLGAF